MLIGVASGVAQLVTFVDWAMVKKKGKKQKQLLNHTFQTLEKLEVNLKQIGTMAEEKKTLTSSEIKKYINLLSEAKSELVKDLFDIGIEVPKKPPKIKEAYDVELLDMLNTSYNEIIKAKHTLRKPGTGMYPYLYGYIYHISYKLILTLLIVVILMISLVFSPQLHFLLFLIFLPVYAFWLVHTSLTPIWFVLGVFGAFASLAIYWYFIYRFIFWVYQNLKKLRE